MSLDDYLQQTAPPPREVRQDDIPKGWEPGVRYDGDRLVVTTRPLADEPDGPLWREIIADWGFDAEVMEIVDGSINLLGYDSPVQGGGSQRLKRYKATFRKRVAVCDHVDVDALLRVAAKRKPPRRKPADVDDVDRAMVVALSDWQLGKGEGDGTEGTVNRIIVAAGRVLDRLAELRKIGRGVDVVYVVGMGDLIEQCSGHYPSQAFTTDLTRRDQMRVARRLILQFVDALVDAGYRVVLTGVAGNHGENRNGAGKAYTTPEDNDDLAVIEQVGDICASNPGRYAGVSVYLPSSLAMCVDICGVPVGFYHGHGATRGANAVAKVANWWTGQIVGMLDVADARILVTGHYHHLSINEQTSRTHMQCPAMDPGSRWWTETTGQHSPAGMLTFVVGAGVNARGWCDLMVL